MSDLNATAEIITGERASVALALSSALAALTGADNDVSAVQVELEASGDARARAQYAACVLLRDHIANAYNAVNSYLTPPDLGTL